MSISVYISYMLYKNIRGKVYLLYIYGRDFLKNYQEKNDYYYFIHYNIYKRKNYIIEFKELTVIS